MQLEGKDRGVQPVFHSIAKPLLDFFEASAARISFDFVGGLFRWLKVGHLVHMLAAGRNCAAKFGVIIQLLLRPLVSPHSVILQNNFLDIVMPRVNE